MESDKCGDDFDHYADKYPILIDLVGIATTRIRADTIKRQTVFDYMKNIVERLNVPQELILNEIGKVMQLYKYTASEAS